MIPPGADLGSAPVAARKRKGFVWQAVRACQGQHTVQDAHCVSAMPKGNKKGRKAMKAYITLALVKGPAVLRVAMIVAFPSAGIRIVLTPPVLSVTEFSTLSVQVTPVVAVVPAGIRILNVAPAVPATVSVKVFLV